MSVALFLECTQLTLFQFQLNGNSSRGQKTTNLVCFELFAPHKTKWMGWPVDVNGDNLSVPKTPQ